MFTRSELMPNKMTTTSVTWFHLRHDSPTGLQHRVVDDLLVLSELTVGREGAGDVTGIATVLPAHVKQAGYRYE